MAGTFTQIYIQIVFAVKGRESLLQDPWKLEVFKYMKGIIENKNQKSIIVNGVGDHVHIFIGFKPVIALSDLVRDIKNNSSAFINSKKWVIKLPPPKEVDFINLGSERARQNLDYDFLPSFLHPLDTSRIFLFSLHPSLSCLQNSLVPKNDYPNMASFSSLGSF
jgi:REP element-mobilizing transposase RayT